MRIVVALGGNALLRRGEPMSAENQRANTQQAASALAELCHAGHELVITHGNGPQVGLLALQGAAYDPNNVFPLDVLGAETEGMVGYLIEQELENVLGTGYQVATLLTQIEVDAEDPAFTAPNKPVGPVYTKAEAQKLANSRHWTIAPDGDGYRRVVASPKPLSIPDIGVIALLIDYGVIVVCTGGGGIPVVRKNDDSIVGIEAVIDKDRSSELLARSIGADMLLMLTDVDAVYKDWGTSTSTPIRQIRTNEVSKLTFPAGSMGPKIEAACDFVNKTNGKAGIGALADALAIVEGRAGTNIVT